jgi:choice-of-anchor A domain-containing protein
MYPGPAQTQPNVWSKMTRIAWIVIPLGVLLNNSLASAAGFDLGAFDTYGLLVNDGTHNADINTAPVNANIGIGDVTGQVNLHNEVVNGKVDCRLSCASDVTGGAITGTQPVSLGGAPSPASLHSNVSAVEDAITTAKNLSTTWGAAAGTAVTINPSPTQTINASSGNLVSGVRVFAATDFAIGNGHTLTINGSAADFVVINITGSGNDKLDGALTLTGGITADHVLINFTGAGDVQGAANGATLQGTFLIPNGKVNLNSLTIAGHLFGGLAGQDFQFVSNAFIAQPPTAVPEPSTMVLSATALIIMGAVYLRRRRSSYTT